jgi:aminopeptidase N
MLNQFQFNFSSVFEMWLKVIITVVLGVAVSGTPLHNDNDSPFLIESLNDVSTFILNPPITYRLPNDSFPLSYDLHLRTDIDQGIADFQGRVKIHIKMRNSTNEIVLHYKQINITNIELRDPETLATERTALTFYYIQSHDFLVIDLGVIKNAGVEIILDIEYIGKLRDDQEGFYRGSYKNENNEDVWYATTQFEIAEARHAMPCYDEPGIRAPIKLAISHKPIYEAHANMPVLTKMSDDNPAYNKTIFMETPAMQTYLLAFLISDFKFKDAPSASTRIPQKIYAISEAIAKGYADYAASVVGAVVKNLDEYIGFNYPLPKLDHVGE